jgi:hypothetical protein
VEEADETEGMSLTFFLPRRVDSHPQAREHAKARKVDEIHVIPLHSAGSAI